MKFSIITAVYNRVKTIGHAIDSVACQTWPDIEHLIIDGASTDGTLTVVNQHRHSRLTVFSAADRGIYDALNKGISLATGDIIGLVHSDDWLAHDHVIQRVADAFAEPGIEAVYGDLDYVSADGGRIIRHWKAGPFSPHKLRLGWMPPHPTLFLRREVFDRLGAYNTAYRIAADYDAILRWFGTGHVRSSYVDEVLVKMRIGGESNRSLSRILRKSAEDYRALRQNNIGGLGALMSKNLSKIHQFILK